MEPRKSRHRDLDAPVAADAGVDTCPVCGIATLSERHCKVVCENCGYTESCEDIFRVSPRASRRKQPHDA